MTKTRSEYIKKLISESNKLDEKLKDVAQTTINNILEEKTNQNLREILSEDKDENSFSEEEVDDNAVVGGSGASGEEGADGNGADDDEWDDLEQYKDEDGEYDLRSMDKDELVKVLKMMSPDDAVRIVKNHDDSITVTDEANDDEYELELDDEDADMDEFGDEEIEIDDDDDDDDYASDGDVIEIDEDEDHDYYGDDDDYGYGDDPDYVDGYGDDPDYVDGYGDDDDYNYDDSIDVELDEGNLGYTDNYQKRTAMTTPDNHEPANPKSTYSMDGGVPKGTGKPWVGSRKRSPFDDEVNESDEVECGLYEEDAEDCVDGVCEGGGEFGKVQSRVSGKQHRNNSSGHGGRPYGSRHNSVAGEYRDYEPGLSEGIKRKANEVFRENKQLRKLMVKLKDQVNEAIVVNQSLANVIKIINENSTTVNEKKDILRRFNDCATRDESNKLYDVISEELKRGGKSHTNVAGAINSQLSESRDRAVETSIYQSKDLSDTIDFMKRLNAIK